MSNYEEELDRLERKIQQLESDLIDFLVVLQHADSLTQVRMAAALVVENRLSA